MKIRAVVPKEEQTTAKFHWRIMNPYKHLAYNCIDAKAIDESEIEEDEDILVLPKMGIAEEDRDHARTWFERIKSQGTTLVYDADDDMFSEAYVSYMTQLSWTPDKGQPILLTLIRELESLREKNIWTMRQCDAVTVSTEYLAHIVQKYTDKPVYVVPNQIDIEAFQNQKWNIERDNITIGWSGGSRPIAELHNMLSAWNIIAQRHDNLRFIIGGWLPKILGVYPNLNIEHRIWSSIDNYAHTMEVDIGCVSASDHEFAKSKSTIKAWEFATAGALVIGSKALYDQEPIAVCETVDDWVRVLEFYIKNIDAREAFADSYTRHVKCYHDLKYNWLYWMDAYSKIQYALGKANDRGQLVGV